MEYLLLGILFIIFAVVFFVLYLIDYGDFLGLSIGFLIAGLLFLIQFFIRCPECDSFTNDLFFRDDYCSECGYCYNPMTYCDCGSSYCSNNLPRFCPECGLALDIEA